MHLLDLDFHRDKQQVRPPRFKNPDSAESGTTCSFTQNINTLPLLHFFPSSPNPTVWFCLYTDIIRHVTSVFKKNTPAVGALTWCCSIKKRKLAISIVHIPHMHTFMSNLSSPIRLMTSTFWIIYSYFLLLTWAIVCLLSPGVINGFNMLIKVDFPRAK